MNGKYPAKTRARPAAAVGLAGLALAVWLAPATVSADFDDLNQGLRIEQQKSRFQLMLEQVQESARQRAGARRSASTERGEAPAPVDLGDWTESVRLDSRSTTVPAAFLGSAKRTEKRLRARHAYEDRQRRILDERQRRDALVVNARSRGSAIDGFSSKHRSRVRYRIENQRLNLQRKLRR